MFMDDSKSIIWVGFKWCESRDSLNFMVFSGGFLVASPTRPFIDTLMFWYIKGVMWYISGPSFIYVRFVVLKFWNFKCFHTSRKYNFRLLLGGFLDVTHWNVVKFVWNFGQWCNALLCMRYMTIFILLFKNIWN